MPGLVRRCAVFAKDWVMGVVEGVGEVVGCFIWIAVIGLAINIPIALVILLIAALT